MGKMIVVVAAMLVAWPAAGADAARLGRELDRLERIFVDNCGGYWDNERALAGDPGRARIASEIIAQIDRNSAELHELLGQDVSNAGNVERLYAEASAQVARNLKLKWLEERDRLDSLRMSGVDHGTVEVQRRRTYQARKAYEEALRQSREPAALRENAARFAEGSIVRLSANRRISDRYTELRRNTYTCWAKAANEQKYFDREINDAYDPFNPTADGSGAGTHAGNAPSFGGGVAQ